MKIREALAQYEPDPDNNFMTLINSIKLRKFIEDLAEQLPAYKFFCWLVIRYTQGLMLPENVEALCDTMGLETTEQLEQWCNAANGQGILDIVDPTFEIERVNLHHMTEIESFVKNHANIESDCSFGYGDAEYYFFSEDELKNALRRCPIDRMKYVISSHDCEDFSHECKAWFSAHGLGNMAFAYAEVNLYKDSILLSAHAINLAPLRDGRVVLVEPQKDINLWPANEPEFGMGADEMKIRKLEF